MSNTEASRAAFEAWASHPDRHGKLPIEAHANGAYKDSRTYSAYYGWQAALNEAAAELAGMTCNNATARSAIQACIETIKEMK